MFYKKSERLLSHPSEGLAGWGDGMGKSEETPNKVIQDSGVCKCVSHMNTLLRFQYAPSIDDDYEIIQTQLVSHFYRL